MLTRRLRTLVYFVSSGTSLGFRCLASVSLTLYGSEGKRVHGRTSHHER